MFRSRKVILSLLAGGIFGALANAASVFNFDSDPAYQTTPFTDTNNGISATFSSSGAVAGFQIDPPGFPGTFKGLTGSVLADPGPLGLSNLSLTITFGPDISTITMNFAVQSSDSAPFILNAFKGANPVGSVTATDSVPAGFTFPEGTISFNAADFNSVVLSTTSPYFAVDNVVVTPASTVPEPGTRLLLGFALLVGTSVCAASRK